MKFLCVSITPLGVPVVPVVKVVHLLGGRILVLLARFTLLLGYVFVMLGFLTMFLLWNDGSPRSGQVALGFFLSPLGSASVSPGPPRRIR